MVPEPQVIETRIHAVLPDELRITDCESDFAREIFRGHAVGSFLEGPPSTAPAISTWWISPSGVS